MLVEGSRRRGRPKLRWEDRLKQDMKELLLSEDMTSDRNATSDEVQCVHSLKSDTLDWKYSLADEQSTSLTIKEMTEEDALLSFQHEYCNIESSKELWNFLDAIYMVEDASSNKFLDSDKLKGNNVSCPSVVNMVEHNNSTMNNDNKGKSKHHDNTRDDDVAWGVDSGAIVHVCKDS
ncbi:hypothetical protein Tco_0345603 [Tanacetum coccineum]